MKRLSWKYIAGFIDGEGCIDFQCHTDKRNKVKRLYLVPRLRITQTEPGKIVVNLLFNNFGGNIEPREPEHWGKSYTWQIQGKKLRPFLQNIVNHLIIKKEQAKFAIWWIDKMMGKSLNNHPGLDAIRRLANDEMKAMKHDPQRLSEWAVRKITDAIVQPV